MGVVGIVPPVIGLPINAVVLNPEGAGTDEQPEPQHEQQPYVETLEERKNRTLSRLSDHLTLGETTTGDNDMLLDLEDIRGNDREAMLNVFGRWAKAEADPHVSPVVKIYEI